MEKEQKTVKLSYVHIADKDKINIGHMPATVGMKTDSGIITRITDQGTVFVGWIMYRWDKRHATITEYQAKKYGWIDTRTNK